MTPRANRELSQIKEGRVVMRHAPDSRHLRNQVARNEDQGCEAAGCGYPRHKLSSLCRAHYRRYEATGHHSAPTIRRGQWRPFVVASSAFVSQQLRFDHPNIAAAVAWCADELLGNRVVARRAEPGRPSTGYSVALRRLRCAGVGPDDLVARWVAAYAFHQWDAASGGRASSRVFKSDEYFRHQAAKLYLHPSPLGAPKWAPGSTDDNQEPGPRAKVGPLVRRFTFERVNAALGVLALRAGEEVNARLITRTSPNGGLPPAQRVDLDATPFITP